MEIVLSLQMIASADTTGGCPNSNVSCASLASCYSDNSCMSMYSSWSCTLA